MAWYWQYDDILYKLPSYAIIGYVHNLNYMANTV